MGTMMMIRGIMGLADIPIHQKGWGWEYWIHNDEDYCGKELIIYAEKKCSIHFHKIKKETFYIVYGKIIIDIFDRPFEVENGDLMGTVKELGKTGQLKWESEYMETGDSLVIEPGIPHRFEGVASETKFIEFSTQHFEEDSYRIWPGDSQNG